MDEDLLPLGNLGVDEGHELVDLIEGRGGEILHADLLVLEARLLDLERVQAVTLETHDDGKPHLPQAGKVPLHKTGARQARAATPAKHVAEQHPGRNPRSNPEYVHTRP